MLKVALPWKKREAGYLRDGLISLCSGMVWNLAGCTFVSCNVYAGWYWVGLARFRDVYGTATALEMRKFVDTRLIEEGVYLL